MRPRWIRRAALVAAMGVILLTVSVGPGLAQRKMGFDIMENQSEGVEIPSIEDPIGAQAAPSASIVAPSATNGDFGANQGNVWDMDSTSDIVWTQPNMSGQTIQLSQPSPGVVRGRVPEGNDLAVAFYASSSTNLPSSQYHHLIYRLKIAAEGSCVTNGRIIYTRAWPNWLGSQEHTRAFSPEHTPMSCPYGNYCVYYMDLSRNNNDGRSPYYDTWFRDPSPWPTDGVKAFGMWPHEVWDNCSGGPNYFDLDYVYLTGDILAREEDGYTYTAQWQVTDPDGGTIVSTVRYMQVDELQLPSNPPLCSSANFGDSTGPPPSYPFKTYLPLIVADGTGAGNSGEWQDFDPPLEVSTAPGFQSLVLDFSDDLRFEDGKSYYLCIRVDDGTSQSYAVSSAPVIRVPLSPNFGPN